MQKVCSFIQKQDKSSDMKEHFLQINRKKILNYFLFCIKFFTNKVLIHEMHSLLIIKRAVTIVPIYALYGQKFQPTNIGKMFLLCYVYD